MAGKQKKIIVENRVLPIRLDKRQMTGKVC